MYLIYSGDKVIALWPLEPPFPPELDPYEKVAWKGEAIFQGDLNHLALEKVRQAKLKQLSAWRVKKYAAGFDTGLGWSLFTTKQSQVTFTSYKVLLDSVVATGAPLGTLVQIGDTCGVTHSVSIAQFFESLLLYGIHCKQITVTSLAISRALKAATTIEAIEIIDLPAP